VLVGIDGSRASIAALRWAAHFATATRRDVHLAHAWQHGRLDGPVSESARSHGAEGIEAEVVERLRQIARRELDDPTVVTTCTALRGVAPHALLGEARRRAASLIAVGAHGEGGAVRRLLGSVGRELTECPSAAVAVVPDEATWSAPVRLVVGVDGSDGSSRALRWAIDNAQRSGAEVIAVHAFEPPASDLAAEETAATAEETRRRLDEEWCAPLRVTAVAHRTIIEPGPPGVVIPYVADRLRPACVVVGSRGLGPVSQLVLASVTHRLVRELPWPTVIVPSPRDCPVFRI
jgi:nucleotide-binding universal stress UspA family protein